MIEANLAPPFNTTRASHAVMTARDLDRTQEFYCDVLGLIATARDPDALYLRALEERSHHSLVFRKTRTRRCASASGFASSPRTISTARSIISGRWG